MSEAERADIHWYGRPPRHIVQLHTHLGTLLALRADGSVDEIILRAYGDTHVVRLLAPHV